MSLLSENTLNIIQCAFSNDKHIVREPISMPCGHSICRNCINDNVNQPIHCRCCGKVVHCSSLINFDESPAVNHIINENVSKLFSVLEDTFQKELNDFNESKLAFDEMLSLRIQNVKEEIDLKLESLKCELDKIYDEFDNQLSECKNKVLGEYSSKTSDTNVYEECLAKLKSEVEKNAAIELFYKYQEIWRQLFKKHAELLDYRYNIAFKDYGYKHASDLIGKVELEPSDFILPFLNEDQRKWTLLYRANKPEFLSDKFHQACDNASATLTIIKANNFNIFGGYTSQSWRWINNGYGGYGYGGQYTVSNYTSYLIHNNFKQDQIAFIFSLKNIFNKPVKCKIDPQFSNRAINCHRYNGPCFGHEICTFCTSNEFEGFSSPLNFYSKTDIDESFLQMPFAGSSYFTIEQIEIFVQN